MVTGHDGTSAGNSDNGLPGPHGQHNVARFYRVLESLRPRMLAYAQHMLPLRTRSSIDPQDAVQDACEKAVRRLNSFDWQSEDGAERWIMTILRNTLIDLVRGQHELTPRPLHDLFDGELEIVLAELVVYERTPSRSALDRERAEQLQGALKGLAEPYRGIVRSRYVEQMSAADVAIETGRTTDSVNKICQRGIAMLRETLAANRPADG